MNKQKLKNSNGITLIALIITIVVLLILAGVAIGALEKSDILGRAKSAGELYETAKGEEEDEMKRMEEMLDKYGTQNNGNKEPSVPQTPDTPGKDVVYPLVKEEMQGGQNVITAVYANQAQACAITINNMINSMLVNGLTPQKIEIPTQGITNEDKTNLTNMVKYVEDMKIAYDNYMNDQTEEKRQVFMQAYSNYGEIYSKYKETVIISEDYTINATNPNTTFASIGDNVELTGKVIFGKNISTIGQQAFEFNDKIKGVVFSEDVETLKRGAFWRCYGIEEVIIPSNIKNIEQDVFSNCTGIKNIVLNNSVMGKYMFSGCSSLEAVIIPENITTMGGYEFVGCSNLKNVTINNGMISEREFSQTGIERITIPGNVKVITNSAFYGCGLLKTVNIESGVEKIENEAFAWTTSLETINMPNSIKKIGPDFTGSSIKNINFTGSLTQWKNIELSEETIYTLLENKTEIKMSNGLIYMYIEENYDDIVLVQK